MNLDVGCGFSTFHRKRRECFKVDIQRSPFIDLICDGQYLPFKEKAFKEVYCSHVIEHCDYPELMSKELLCIADEFVYIECPRRFSFNAKQSGTNPFDRHKHLFNCNWFHNALRRIPHHVEVRYSFPLYLYIICEIYLKGK